MSAAELDHKQERTNDVNRIKDSAHPRKVVVAGPGTGKSFLFSELIKKKRAEGKKNFLAITFIGKLGDALADDLCGLAKTHTMHGFARGFVLEHCKGWVYYPDMYDVIKEDLNAEGIENFEIGDENYVRRTKHYRAVGDADVVHYAVQICKKDPNKIPIFDLILVDEYQDFNAIESEFVDQLALRNEMVIVGDDDQALYAFKGSSPSFIRAKFDGANKDFESHTLRFCSRCTEVIIRYFHSLVAAFNLNEAANGRIQKDYVCYVPDKAADSRANPKIHLIKSCPVGMIAYKIHDELEQLIESQKIKDVLVIGEGRSCEALLRGIAQQLRNYGLRNVDYRAGGTLLSFNKRAVDAYKLIAKDEASLLGWRLLGNPADGTDKKQHLKNAKTLDKVIGGSPSEIQKLKSADIELLETVIEDWPAVEAEVASGDNGAVRAQQNEEVRRSVLVQEIKRANLYSPRPLCNLDITVCNILNSKGLGADIVFLVGFDQGKFPAKKEVQESEVYQMLVAITRAKKRLYLVNTIERTVSKFADFLDAADVEIEKIETSR